MKRIVVTSFGIVLAISMASPNCWATIFQFDGGADDASLPYRGQLDTITMLTLISGCLGVGDRAIINNDFVVTYGTAVTTTVGSLIVGADWPATGELGTDGTLNMTAGKIIVTGGGDNFQIARAAEPSLAMPMVMA